MRKTLRIKLVLKSTNESGSTRSRLRLTAGLIVLKLCTTRLPDKTAIYENMFTPRSFNLVSLLAQDDCPEVRHGFLEALRNALANGLLSSRWYTLCFLTAFEPNEDFKEVMVRWLKNRAENYRMIEKFDCSNRRSSEGVRHGEDVPKVIPFTCTSHRFLQRRI